jgi:hypothetical protein
MRRSPFFPISLAISLAIAGLVSAVSFASTAETCHTTETQFGKFRTCVSSVLPPQAGNSYGPDHLNGMGDRAWCEGAPGPGIGQTITLHQEPRQTIRTLNITNGYAKSDDTFRRNGRIKTATIETDRGYKRTVTLKDTREPQKITIAKAKIGWVRLTIASVTAGSRDSDTCVSEFLTNVEEFANE